MLIELGLLAAMTGSLAPSEVNCVAENKKEGGCITATLTDDSAILEGGIGGGTGGSATGTGNPADPDPITCDDYIRGCVATVTAPVTLADIAAFRPDPGPNRMQPNGWAVIGLDTNFYSTGGAQIHAGQLLAQPADVRFTPSAWHWSYGDGSAKTASSPGGTWAALGIPEFDPTPGSHVYRERGTYTITLTINYRAEYRYAGGPWVPIAGRLAVASNPLVITAGTASTVLVYRDCLARPTGPGC